MLLSNIEDKISACFAEGTAQYSDFLTLEETHSVQALLKSVGVSYEFWGGFDDAQRKIVKIYDNEISDSYPITILCGAWDRFAEISHRDILGSIMASGIERKCVGDILIDAQHHRFYLFCIDRMSDYLMQNIDRIGRSSVRWEIVSDLSLLPQTAAEERKVSVSSCRIDVIVAAVLHLSRQKSQDLVNEKRVYLNHTLVNKSTQVVHPGDSVVVRGYGKFIFLEQSGVSKKGKTYILIKQYQ